ncbi:MAG: SPASM domain-containing protein, partial [Armatimonadetes bacterium]|nr:SPASM domain-containing protein [Armatimonadota bacterium]
EYNALVLVNAANVGRSAQVYKYLCRLGIRYHQYIPCVEFDEHGNLAPYAVTGVQWGEFMLGIFEQWYPHDVRRISVRLFDSILSVLLGRGATVCYMGRDCRQYFVVEYNGDVYPCDFFVEPHLLLGNIMTHSWDELQASGLYREFGRMKARWNRRCNSCQYLDFCHGDCLKMRLYAGNDPRTLSWLCEGWRVFYRRTLPVFRRLAAEIVSRQRT